MQSTFITVYTLLYYTVIWTTAYYIQISYSGVVYLGRESHTAMRYMAIPVVRRKYTTVGGGARNHLYRGYNPQRWFSSIISIVGGLAPLILVIPQHWICSHKHWLQLTHLSSSTMCRAMLSSLACSDPSISGACSMCVCERNMKVSIYKCV